MKFTAAILALAAVSSAQAFTVTNPARNGIAVEWTTTNAQDDFQFKMTDTIAAGDGYACIGISYGSNGGYHNSMESYCTDKDAGGVTRLYVGPSNSKSMPVFPGGNNPQGYTAAPGGDSVMKAIAINTNGGTTTSTWTRTKANRYAGADVSKESMNNGRFLNREWYYEDNKEYVIWYAAGAGKALSQKHSGTGKWSDAAQLFRVTDPLTPRQCSADHVCTGLSAAYTGINKPLPAECSRQNDCSNNDCCEKAPPVAGTPTPVAPVEVDPLATPGGSGTGDVPAGPVTVVDPNVPAVKNLCAADFPCESFPGWKKIDDIAIQGCLEAVCDKTECCVPDGSGVANPNPTTNPVMNPNVRDSAGVAFAPTAVTAVLASISALFLYL